MVSLNDTIKQQQTNKYSATDHCYLIKQKCMYIVKSEVRTRHNPLTMITANPADVV